MTSLQQRYDEREREAFIQFAAKPKNQDDDILRLDLVLDAAGLNPGHVLAPDEFLAIASPYVAADPTLAKAAESATELRRRFAHSQTRARAREMARREHRIATRDARRESTRPVVASAFGPVKQFNRDVSAASRLVTPLLHVGQVLCSPSDDDWTITKVNPVTVRVRNGAGYERTVHAYVVYEANRETLGDIDGYTTPVLDETEQQKQQRELWSRRLNGRT